MGGASIKPKSPLQQTAALVWVQRCATYHKGADCVVVRTPRTALAEWRGSLGQPLPAFIMRRTMTAGNRVLVTGGAGFLGSHLCERLLAEGKEVLCVDNYFTGSRLNLNGLLSNPRFEALRHDITFPLFPSMWRWTPSTILLARLRRFNTSATRCKRPR